MTLISATPEPRRRGRRSAAADAAQVPMSRAVSMSRARLVVALATATALLCGCATIQRMFGGDEAERQAEKLQELQLRVMRFADEYVGGVKEAAAAFQATTKDPQVRLAAQN